MELIVPVSGGEIWAEDTGGNGLGLALSEPERVTSLVLIAPGLPDYPWPDNDPYAVELTRERF
jgi:pimeloyl-ACP methyl ester carboxylesterase